MRRLLAVLVLSMILVQTILLPSSVWADDPQFECPTFTHTKLAANHITWTSAFVSVQICVTGSGVFNQAGTPDYGNSVYFEYGTAPGVYTNKVQVADISSIRNNKMSAGGNGTETICLTYAYNAHNLTPCTTYYVRFWFVWDPGHGCEIFRYSDEISFKTEGCMIGKGQGSLGISPGTPTTWPKPVEMSNIIVQSAAVATSKVSQGQVVDVAASVTNKGTVNGASKLTLYVNGEEVESKGVTVSGGQTAPVHFYVSRNEPGTYSVYVNGVSAGSFEVDPFNNNDILIYGIIALFMLGIAGMLYFILKRRTA